MGFGGPASHPKLDDLCLGCDESAEMTGVTLLSPWLRVATSPREE
jgi:hypothetical protein